MNPFIPWAIYVALQIIVRRSQRKSELLPRHSSLPATPPRQPYGNHTPNNLRPTSVGTRPSDLPYDKRIDAQALDSMHFLLSKLADIKGSNGLAEVLEDQVNHEIAEGQVSTQERFVGLVNFPLLRPGTQSGGEDNNNMDALFHI